MSKRKPTSSAKKLSSKKSSKASQKRAAEERERGGVQHTAHEGSKYLRGPRIDPRPIDGTENVADLIDNAFLAY
ncbi:MAG TPA: hypothetical protein VFR41_12640, partial [Acidimicrobiia bacterium]|nr:hypothetical protein [Acidimicrobiia bacterium]